MLHTAARRSGRRVMDNAAASGARLDASLVASARRFGHHGVVNFVETVRQFHRAAITEAYARDLLARGGYPDPKP